MVPFFVYNRLIKPTIQYILGKGLIELEIN